MLDTWRLSIYQMLNNTAWVMSVEGDFFFLWKKANPTGQASDSAAV